MENEKKRNVVGLRGEDVEPVMRRVCFMTNLMDDAGFTITTMGDIIVDSEHVVVVTKSGVTYLIPHHAYARMQVVEET